MAADSDPLRRHLEILRISHLAEWDVLTFLYRHGTILASAKQIARLVGYTGAEVGAALDSLTSTGLLLRSRNSHGVRMYQLAAIFPDERRCSLEELMRVAEKRHGRSLLIGQVQHAAEGKELRGRRSGLHLA
jgi:DNA-binding MarR family transcriptional regulator